MRLAENLPENTEDWEEPADARLRKRLGLRPVAYRDDIESQTQHPDPDPCPTWCWLNNDNADGYAHEVDQTHPMAATHTLDPEPSTVASLYRGRSQSNPNLVETATIETRLSQHGARAPMVQLYLRHYVRQEGQQRSRYDERLRLTVADARELVTALTYVCDVAEGKA